MRVIFRTPGSQTVTVTDAAGKLLPGSATIWVLRPEDLRFVLNAPGSVGAGQPFGVTVHVRNRLDNWTKGYGGTVRFTCTDPGAKLPANYTFNREEVVRTFTGAVTLPNPGRWTVTVTDPAVKGLSASATVVVRSSRGD